MKKIQLKKNKNRPINVNWTSCSSHAPRKSCHWACLFITLKYEVLFICDTECYLVHFSALGEVTWRW